MEEAKQELQEVVEFLKNPQKFTVLGGKLPKGKVSSLSHDLTKHCNIITNLTFIRFTW